MLDGQTLAVGELCDILQLPQSTISRHLKTLTDGGWAQVRREGTSRLYSLVADDLDPQSADLWRVVKGQLLGTPAWRRIGACLTRVLAERRAESAAYFSRTAGEWDAVRDEPSASTFHLAGAAGALDPRGSSPTSAAARAAPRRRSRRSCVEVVAVDASAEMLAAARRAAGRHRERRPSRRGRSRRCRWPRGRSTSALLVLVLHHLGDPGAVLREAWITSSNPDENDPAHPKFGSGAAYFNVIDIGQSYPQHYVKLGVMAVDHDERVERSAHLGYEKVVLTTATAEQLGQQVSEEDRKRGVVSMSGRKGLGVKTDDFIDQLEANALAEVASRHPS